MAATILFISVYIYHWLIPYPHGKNLLNMRDFKPNLETTIISLVIVVWSYLVLRAAPSVSWSRFVVHVYRVPASRDTCRLDLRELECRYVSVLNKCVQVTQKPSHHFTTWWQCLAKDSQLMFQGTLVLRTHFSLTNGWKNRTFLDNQWGSPGIT